MAFMPRFHARSDARFSFILSFPYTSGVTMRQEKGLYNVYQRMRYLISTFAFASLAFAADIPSFEQTVEPFIAKNCVTCHNSKTKSGELDLQIYHDSASFVQGRDTWERVVQKVRSGEMPPKGLPRPAVADVKQITGWIESEFDRIDRSAKPDPGRVTAHRLNRVEYNNTVRDLIGVNFHPADDFPADDAGYGFDNIGDVLSLSPVLMEKYLKAAEKIVKAAIVVGWTPMKPTREKFSAESGAQKKAEKDPLPKRDPAALHIIHQFPVEGEYEIRASLAGKRPTEPMKATLWIDGKVRKTYDLVFTQDQQRAFELRVPLTAGLHRIGGIVTAVQPGVVLDNIEVRGPYNQLQPPLPASHTRIIFCGHQPGQHNAECARKIVTEMARKAYRRPATEREVDNLLKFVAMAQKEGDPLEQGIRVALEAMLVSPNFLFRIERDQNPADPGFMHPVGEFELASRLSYFLWSSMPDDQLLRLAEAKTLRDPGVLHAQVKRMLADPKSKALVENFGGQWLQLRNLDSVKPDPDKFPEFDLELRDAMKRETQMFFETIVQEDRSILDFIDAKFTFLNERLAQHYGIAGVEGPEMRRVALKGDRRSGVLTQASVLTVSSYPTRTSPVVRGKWVLENILNTPPPPPPPGVPNLNEEAVGSTASLRKQLEQHRANSMCASCHSKMDPLGFGLENYDAIGKWRTMDGKFPIDSSGVLPNGKSFQGSAGLKGILRAGKDEFTDCVTEKMLTYALGRGLERYDKPAVKSISKKVADGSYRFSRLILEIVDSMPFEMRRGDGAVKGT